MSMSQKQFNKMMKDGHAKIRDLRSGESMKNPRMNSKKTEIDGHVFDSITEANIYNEFKLDPDIKILELQPQFTLMEGFKLRGESYRPIKFTADFRIEQDDEEWIVDVKSIGTLKANSKSYPMRRKLFLKNNPELRFKEIIFDGKKRSEKVY